MDKSKKPPSKKNALPTSKEVLEGYNINDGSFGNIAIVNETKGYYQKTGSHHIVNGLIVANLEFQGK